MTGRQNDIRPTGRFPLLRRGPMEMLATAVIAAGFLMLFQPYVLAFYSYSFATMLAGVAMFVVVSKFPE